MESESFQLDFTPNRILITQLNCRLYFICGLLLLSFGSKYIKFASTFLAYNILLGLTRRFILFFKLSHYIINIKPIVVIILLIIARLFYYYPKPIVYLYSIFFGLFIGLFFGLFLNFFIGNEPDLFIPSVIAVTTIVLVILTYYRMNKVQIFSTASLGAFIMIFSFKFIIEFKSSISIVKYDLDDLEILKYTGCTICLFVVGSIFQWNNLANPEVQAPEKASKKTSLEYGDF